MTKTALLGMVKVLAPELAQSNIRINGLAPGLIQTKLSDPVSDSILKLKHFMNFIIQCNGVKLII